MWIVYSMLAVLTVWNIYLTMRYLELSRDNRKGHTHSELIRY